MIRIFTKYHVFMRYPKLNSGNRVRIIWISLCLIAMKITFVASNDEIARKKLINDVLCSEQFITGYTRFDEQLTESELSDKSVEMLNEILQQNYNALKCSYLFSALVHLRQTRELLLDGGFEYLGLSTVYSFSYDEEIIKMIHSMLLVRGLRINELWLLLISTHKIKMYLLDLESDTPPGKKVRKSNLSMHDFVVDEIQKFTDKSCNKDNMFDWKSYAFIFAREYENIAKSKKPNNVMLSVVKDNKFKLNDIIVKNVMQGLNLNVGKLLSVQQLYLLDVAKFKEVVDKFLTDFTDTMDWGETQSMLLAAYHKAIGPGLKSIKALGIYQQMFVDILKIIMLQLTWKHMLYVSQIEHTANIVQQHVSNFKLLVKEFVDYVGLNNIIFFKGLVAYFQTDISYFMMYKNAAIEELKKEIKQVSLGVGCNHIEPTCSDHLNFLIRHETDFNDTFNSAIAFISFIKQVFSSKFIFEMVQSFNQMTVETNKTIVLQLSNKKTKDKRNSKRRKLVRVE